jgi:hypothetical protein
MLRRTHTPHDYTTPNSHLDEVRREYSDTSTSSTSKPPVIESRNPPSWVELVPWDVRSLVLQELTKQPQFEAVQADLASYARTSKAASTDVKAFHRQWRDPRASLLASRNLVQCAWEAATARSWFSPKKEFISAIKSAASDFSAIVIDGRAGVAYEAYVPAAISALLESDIEHLHFRLGYSRHMESDFCDQLEGLQELITASMERLKKGKSLPTVFLHVQGIPVRTIAATLKTSAVRLNIVGFALCFSSENFKIDVRADEMGKKTFFMGDYGKAKLADWDALFSQLKDIRYLNLNGWSGKDLSAALNTWFHRFQKLEELHLPQSAVTAPCFVGISQAIEAKTTFKCLDIDYADIKPVLGFDDSADMISVLNNNPEMRLIRTTTYPVLTESLGLKPFWEQGRYLISSIPHAMRALPELYGQVDFFRPATS